MSVSSFQRRGKQIPLGPTDSPSPPPSSSSSPFPSLPPLHTFRGSNGVSFVSLGIYPFDFLFIPFGLPLSSQNIFNFDNLGISNKIIAAIVGMGIKQKENIIYLQGNTGYGKQQEDISEQFEMVVPFPSPSLSLSSPSSSPSPSYSPLDFSTPLTVTPKTPNFHFIPVNSEENLLFCLQKIIFIIRKIRQNEKNQREIPQEKVIRIVCEFEQWNQKHFVSFFSAMKCVVKQNNSICLFFLGNENSSVKRSNPLFSLSDNVFSLREIRHSSLYSSSFKSFDNILQIEKFTKIHSLQTIPTYNTNTKKENSKTQMDSDGSLSLSVSAHEVTSSSSFLLSVSPNGFVITRLFLPPGESRHEDKENPQKHKEKEGNNNTNRARQGEAADDSKGKGDISEW